MAKSVEGNAIPGCTPLLIEARQLGLEQFLRITGAIPADELYALQDYEHQGGGARKEDFGAATAAEYYALPFFEQICYVRDGVVYPCKPIVPTLQYASALPPGVWYWSRPWPGSSYITDKESAQAGNGSADTGGEKKTDKLFDPKLPINGDNLPDIETIITALKISGYGRFV